MSPGLHPVLSVAPQVLGSARPAAHSVATRIERNPPPRAPWTAPPPLQALLLVAWLYRLTGLRVLRRRLPRRRLRRGRQRCSEQDGGQEISGERWCHVFRVGRAERKRAAEVVKLSKQTAPYRDLVCLHCASRGCPSTHTARDTPSRTAAKARSPFRALTHEIWCPVSTLHTKKATRRCGTC